MILPVIILMLANSRLVSSSYSCLCFYADHTPVLKSTVIGASEVIGILNSFDCKAIYHTDGLDPRFSTIQYNGQVGYVVNDESSHVQTCAGYPLSTDIVPTTPTATTESLVMTEAPATRPQPTTPTETSSTTASSSATTTERVTTTTEATTTTTQPLKPHCPNNWIEFGHSCYAFWLDGHTKTWGDAQKKCAADNGHLVFIESAAEQKFIHDQLNGRFHHLHSSTHDQRVWIGWSDHQHEGHWAWNTPHGEQISPDFTHWNPGQPDNQHGSDCGLIRADYAYHWDDEPCHNHRRYICENEQTSPEIIGK